MNGKRRREQMQSSRWRKYHYPSLNCIHPKQSLLFLSISYRIFPYNFPPLLLQCCSVFPNLLKDLNQKPAATQNSMLLYLLRYFSSLNSQSTKAKAAWYVLRPKESTQIVNLFRIFCILVI